MANNRQIFHLPTLIFIAGNLRLVSNNYVGFAMSHEGAITKALQNAGDYFKLKILCIILQIKKIWSVDWEGNQTAYRHVCEIDQHCADRPIINQRYDFMLQFELRLLQSRFDD